MHGFQFIFQQGGGGFGQDGVGGGIPDDSIMTLGSNKLGLSCAKLNASLDPCLLWLTNTWFWFANLAYELHNILV